MDPVDARVSPIHAPLRSQGDPAADAAIGALLAAGSAPRSDLLAAALAQAAAGDPECRAFVDVFTRTPAWVDHALIERGRQLSLALAFPSGVVLLLGGLTEVYAVPEIARVLVGTGRLERQTWRRILETGRFIRDVHQPGGLRPGNEGVRAIARVRLVHALVRRRLPGADPRRSVDQATMAFTLCAHSHVVRRGLAALGFPLTADEARAHQHLWRTVGHYMGIAPPLLAADPGGEADLYARLYAELVDGAGPESRRLVAASVACIAAQAHVPRALVRTTLLQLVGDELGRRLEVPPAPGWRLALRGVAGVHRLLNATRRRVPPLQHTWAVGGQAFVDRVVATDPGHLEPVGVAAGRDVDALGARAAGEPPT